MSRVSRYKSAEALDEERVELRVRLAVLRDRGGANDEIAAVDLRIKQLDRSIKAMRQGNQ